MCVGHIWTAAIQVCTAGKSSMGQGVCKVWCVCVEILPCRAGRG